MTAGRRVLPLRAVLVILGLTSFAYVAAVSLQVVTILRPTASELRGLTRDLLTDHDAISVHLAKLREARRQISRLAPPLGASGDALPQPEALRHEVRDLLDGSASIRAALERADVPFGMRLLLAEAVEQEASVSVRLLEALRAIELEQPREATDALRLSGVHSDSATQLLASAQRVALTDLLAGQERLFARLTVFEVWTLVWAALGVVIFGVGAAAVHRRFYVPVLMMERAVRKVAAGDLTAEVVLPQADELGRLASHLNAMTAVLRERAAEESRRRESITERFGRILDESASQICVFDASTMLLVQANRGARVSLGYSREEIAGLRLSDLFGGLSEERLRGLLEELRSGEQPRLMLATWLRRKDGGVQPTDVTIQHSSDGASSVFITVAEDAGVRQRVRELDERLREFTRTHEAVLMSGDPENALRPLTAMAAEALQATRCGVWRQVGGAPRSVVSYDARTAQHRVDAPWPELASPRSGAPLIVPVRAGARVVATVVIEHEGEERQWTAEERTFAGAVADVVLRVIDAAERRTLEQALERAQRMDSIGQLAGGVAHDFNNILTAILGNLEECRADLAPGDKMDVALAEAEEAARRAAELTRQLMTFARQQVVETQVVDVNERARAAEPMLRRLLGAELALETTLDPSLATVRLGAGQAEQLLVNLVVNARDATPAGGRISIATRMVTLDAAQASEDPGAMAGTYVEIEVTDTGSGMDPRTVERIFEPFFTTKHVGAGTGLGLAVCYGVVRNAGGWISVVSAPGRGSTFRVRLPAAQDRPSPVGARAPVGSGDELVLLVEDEPAIRALLERMLRARGFRVLVAVDGVDAVARSAEHPGPIALLISDVVMPNLGGPEAARRIRERRPGLPVLFMSGFTASAAPLSGDLADAGFIAKPFTPDELGRRVREVLDAAALVHGGSAPSH